MVEKKNEINNDEIRVIDYSKSGEINTQNSNSFNVIKRKKPLLERLGFIEKVQVEKTDNINDNIKDETIIDTQGAIITQLENNIKLKEVEKEMPKEEEQIDNVDTDFIDKLGIEEIYSNNGISMDTPSNIYVIENYLKALPISLPNDVKKDTVASIITATNLKSSLLQVDGTKKVITLDKYLQSFSKKTNEIIKDNENKISDMLNQIEILKQSISERKKIQEEQKSVVDFEIEKIKSLLEYINID